MDARSFVTIDVTHIVAHEPNQEPLDDERRTGDDLLVTADWRLPTA